MKYQSIKSLIRLNPVNTDSEGGGAGGIESVRINGVSVLTGLNFEKMFKGFLFSRTKQIVRKNEESELSGCPYGGVCL